MNYPIIISVLLGIFLLLLLILYFRIPAFISLLVASIFTGLMAGLDGPEIMQTVQKGMSSTLGFVAVVVGLGAMFGAILEKSKGAQAISRFLIKRFGIQKAPLAMLFTGVIVAIPVFFDVAFIILVPVIYALQRETGKSLLLFAIPLLSGLAITHAFIPPTPGPVAVADILEADLGWVILVGLIASIPTALISGYVFGKYIGNRIPLSAQSFLNKIENDAEEDLPPFGLIAGIIAIPIVLILISTFLKSGILQIQNENWADFFSLIGHPFMALIIANLVVWYFLGIRRGYSSKTLFEVTTKSMEPAGTIILLTGAGGVFKQVLVDTGAGEMIANIFVEMGLPVIVFAFIAAVLIRVLQGSATVAMITAAGLVAPLLINVNLSAGELAALVIAIASGASTTSHVNDSGFWLVKEYLGMTEGETFRSWTMMTTILAICGFGCAVFLFWVF